MLKFGWNSNLLTFDVRNTQSHMTEIALKHMPAAFQNLDKEKSVTRPNLNTFIFFQVKEDCDDVSIPINVTFYLLLLIFNPKMIHY